jgi:hypothetical protein
MFSGGHNDFFQSEYGSMFNHDEEPEHELNLTFKPNNPTIKGIKDLSSLSDNTGNMSKSSSSSLNGSEIEETQSDSQFDDSEGEVRAPRKLIREEKRAIGSIKLEVWKTYFTASGNIMFWILNATAFVGSKLTEVGESWWLR